MAMGMTELSGAVADWQDRATAVRNRPFGYMERHGSEKIEAIDLTNV
jgi:hypothetical protein